MYSISIVVYLVSVFCFKQKKAYEMRISDWSSDVCSSDLKTRWKPGCPTCLSKTRRKAASFSGRAPACPCGHMVLETRCAPILIVIVGLCLIRHWQDRKSVV